MIETIKEILNFKIIDGKEIDITIGTIDPDYRGELQAIVSNTTAKSFTIKDMMLVTIWCL